jgi:hypothetical protein
VIVIKRKLIRLIFDARAVLVASSLRIRHNGIIHRDAPVMAVLEGRPVAICVGNRQGISIYVHPIVLGVTIGRAEQTEAVHDELVLLRGKADIIVPVTRPKLTGSEPVYSKVSFGNTTRFMLLDNSDLVLSHEPGAVVTAGVPVEVPVAAFEVFVNIL